MYNLYNKIYICWDIEILNKKVMTCLVTDDLCLVSEGQRPSCKLRSLNIVSQQALALKYRSKISARSNLTTSSSILCSYSLKRMRENIGSKSVIFSFNLQNVCFIFINKRVPFEREIILSLSCQVVMLMIVMCNIC